MSRSTRMNSAAATALIMSTLMLVVINSGYVNATAPYDCTTWSVAHATFYGGDDASGTMGGACGYGNLYSRGYGTNTAALSTTLFNGGLSCGACFEIQCILSKSRWCYANAGSIKITATNLCPPNWARTKDGWCNPPQLHFDLAYPAFAHLAQKVGGIIPVEYRRISCIKQGGIRYSMAGNPWFNLVLVYNVAGGGNVVKMEMKGSSSSFYTMLHNWGQNWELKQKLCGQAISFQVTLGNGKQLVSTDVAPSSWGFGQTFECIHNF